MKTLATSRLATLLAAGLSVHMAAWAQSPSESTEAIPSSPRPYPADLVAAGDERAYLNLPGVTGLVADLGLPELHGGIIVQLALPPALREAVQIDVPMMELKGVTMLLEPKSVRAENYQILVQNPDGTWTQATPGPEKTYTGRLSEFGGSEVAASLLSDGLWAAVWLPDGTSRWVQPLSTYLPGADPTLHVVYRDGDTDCEGFCGTGDAQLVVGDTPEVRGGCGGSVCVAQIAFDCDWQYYNARGSIDEVQDDTTAILNVVNHQYVREVSIEHVVGTILVRTVEPDPYSSFDANILLDQFKAEWTGPQAGIARDVAHLFTGREIDGGTIGLAWVGAVCNFNFEYGLVESDFSANFACKTDLSAHELGHNWGAGHCTCTSSTMNPFITCTNTFLNSGTPSSGSQIDDYSDGLGCLGSRSSIPANNTCNNAVVIQGNGTVTGSNVNATTDGASACSPDDGGGAFDVFWKLTPPMSGVVTINTLSSSFDTVLSVHTDCPASIVNEVVCNDDSNGGLQSELSFNAVGRQTYYVRVSGYNGATGSIVLSVDCPLPIPSNTLCSQAAQINDGQTLFGSLYSQGADGDSNCGTSDGNRDVWYSFVSGCNGTLTIDTCGTNDFPAVDEGMDTVVSLHSACTGSEANQLDCNDDGTPTCSGASGSNFDSRATTTVTAGQEVLIRVTHFNESFNNGMFQIRATLAETQTAPVINAIANATIPAGVAYLGPIPSMTQPVCMTGVSWSLVTFPAGMTIAANGRVSWASPVVAGSPHAVRIRATNAQGFDDEIWTLTVTPDCPEDLNNDGQVNLTDLAILLTNFGGAGTPAQGDINGDGQVNLTDLAMLLIVFGGSC